VSEAPDPRRARAFLLLQHLLPRTGLTRLLGALSRARGPAWLRRLAIRTFIRHFRVDMSEAANSDPDAYGSFEAFFTRRLRHDVRHWEDDPAVVASPCDGTVSECGPLDGRRMVQAKGRAYSVDELLADPRLGEQFRDGSFATLYLSPRDYHRVHMPQNATLERMVYVPGGLYSVNAMTVTARDRLFARNERVVSIFRGPAGRFAMVLVGAMVVGGIRTTWAGRVTPRTREPWHVTTEARIAFERGDEMGLFELGSTVILVYPSGAVGWRPELLPGTPIRLGETLGRVLEPRPGPGDAP
jgi:phosphatidylserine decarboxylase